MSEARGVVDLAGFDPFGAGVAGTLLMGGASVLLPFLAAGTATLAALSVAAWAARPPDRTGRNVRLVTTGAALAGLGGAAIVFVDPPAGVVPYRAILLAVALLGLFAAARWGPRGREAR